jgi:hypothetical protein
VVSLLLSFLEFIMIGCFLGISILGLGFPSQEEKRAFVTENPQHYPLASHMMKNDERRQETEEKREENRGSPRNDVFSPLILLCDKEYEVCGPFSGGGVRIIFYDRSRCGVRFHRTLPSLSRTPSSVSSHSPLSSFETALQYLNISCEHSNFFTQKLQVESFSVLLDSLKRSPANDSVELMASSHSTAKHSSPSTSSLFQNLIRFVVHLFLFTLNCASQFLRPLGFCESAMVLDFQAKQVGLLASSFFKEEWPGTRSEKEMRDHGRETHDRQWKMRRMALNLTFAFAFNVILGLLAFGVLHYSSFSPSSILFSSFISLNHGVIETIIWFCRQPGGFKLNDTLCFHLSHSLVFFVAHFSRFISFYSQSLSIFFDLSLSISFLLGLSCFMAFLSDILSLLMLHIRLLDAVFRWATSKWISSLSFLFLLFRGKRRENSGKDAYDTEQLLVGTILFTILLFLFPTLLAFSANFFLLRMALNLIQGLLFSVISCVSRFPIHDFITSFLDGERLSQGSYFQDISHLFLEDPHSSSITFRFSSSSSSPSSCFVPPSQVPSDTLPGGPNGRIFSFLKVRCIPSSPLSVIASFLPVLSHSLQMWGRQTLSD